MGVEIKRPEHETQCMHVVPKEEKYTLDKDLTVEREERSQCKMTQAKVKRGNNNAHF